MIDASTPILTDAVEGTKNTRHTQGSEGTILLKTDEYRKICKSEKVLKILSIKVKQKPLSQGQHH